MPRVFAGVGHSKSCSPCCGKPPLCQLGVSGCGAASQDTNAYAARSYSQVYGRIMSETPTASWLDYWVITYDSSPGWHGQATVRDGYAGTKKLSTFSQNGDFTAGLATAYQELNSSNTALPQKNPPSRRTATAACKPPRPMPLRGPPPR